MTRHIGHFGVARHFQSIFSRQPRGEAESPDQVFQFKCLGVCREGETVDDQMSVFEGLLHNFSSGGRLADTLVKDNPPSLET